MTPNDLPDFAVLLACVGSIYSKTASEGLIELYWQLLKPYSLAAVQQGIQAHLRDPDTGQYFPKPADLVRRIGGSNIQRADAAWAKVEGAIRRVGGYRDVAFDDAFIHCAIEALGGWVTLCRHPGHRWDAISKQFLRHYQRLLTESQAPYPAYLRGQLTQSLSTEPPTLIGDPRQARAVMQAGKLLPDAALSVQPLPDVPDECA